MWFLVIDAYSKWPEVHAMSATTAQATVQQLREIFATHGFPQMIVSDNGPQKNLNSFVVQGISSTILLLLTIPALTVKLNN